MLAVRLRRDRIPQASDGASGEDRIVLAEHRGERYGAEPADAGILDRRRGVRGLDGANQRREEGAVLIPPGALAKLFVEHVAEAFVTGDDVEHGGREGQLGNGPVEGVPREPVSDVVGTARQVPRAAVGELRLVDDDALDVIAFELEDATGRNVPFSA